MMLYIEDGRPSATDQATISGPKDSSVSYTTYMQARYYGDNAGKEEERDTLLLSSRGETPMYNPRRKLNTGMHYMIISLD